MESAERCPVATERPPPPDGGGDVLPWWVRMEHRLTLSLAKRLSSARGRRVAARVPAVDAFARRFLGRVSRIQVRVCGGPFRLDVMGRSVSRSVFLGGRWHRSVVETLRSCVRPGMTAVDVGANVGYMAVQMADVVGPEGTVLAFEPEPRNFSFLAWNARHARWRNVVPFPLAIGDVCGESALYLSPENGGDHRLARGLGPRASVRVPITTLDDLLAQRRTEVHFVKMDIQGAEAAALRGMRRTLASPRLRGLAVEFWPDALRLAGDDPAAVLAMVRAGGLRCASHPLVDEDPAAFLGADVPEGGTDLLFVRPD